LNLRFNREFVISERACSSLTHLSIDACFSCDILQFLSCCSNLQSLTIKVEQSRRRYPLQNLLNSSDQNLPKPPYLSLICSYLTSFSIDINDLTFTDMKSYLLLMPFLKHFRLEGLTYDLDFAKSDIWRTIFENFLSKLKLFELTGLRIWLGNNADDDEDNLSLISQITNSFGRNDRYWGKFWCVHQAHKLRPNHINLTLRAKAI